MKIKVTKVLTKVTRVGGVMIWISDLERYPFFNFLRKKLKRVFEMTLFSFPSYFVNRAHSGIDVDCFRGVLANRFAFNSFHTRGLPVNKIRYRAVISKMMSFFYPSTYYLETQSMVYIGGCIECKV
jgi:hypothetical protein